MQIHFRKIFFLSFLSPFLIALCYFFIDRQLVWFLVAHHSRRFVILKIFTNDIVSGIAILIFYIMEFRC